MVDIHGSFWGQLAEPEFHATACNINGTNNVTCADQFKIQLCRSLTVGSHLQRWKTSLQSPFNTRKKRLQQTNVPLRFQTSINISNRCSNTRFPTDMHTPAKARGLKKAKLGLIHGRKGLLSYRLSAQTENCIMRTKLFLANTHSRTSPSTDAHMH